MIAFRGVMMAIMSGIEGIDLRSRTGLLVISFGGLREAIVAALTNRHPIWIGILVMGRLVTGLGPIMARILLGCDVPGLVLFGPLIPARRRLPRPMVGSKPAIVDVAEILPVANRLVGLRAGPSGI